MSYKVDHKFGNARFLLIVSQLMELEKNFFAKMKGTVSNKNTHLADFETCVSADISGTT